MIVATSVGRCFVIDRAHFVAVRGVSARRCDPKFGVHTSDLTRMASLKVNLLRKRMRRLLCPEDLRLFVRSAVGRFIESQVFFGRSDRDDAARIKRTAKRREGLVAESATSEDQ